MRIDLSVAMVIREKAFEHWPLRPRSSSRCGAGTVRAGCTGHLIGRLWQYRVALGQRCVRLDQPFDFGVYDRRALIPSAAVNSHICEFAFFFPDAALETVVVPRG